jgi:8-oxo-dGTP diphosphatase
MNDELRPWTRVAAYVLCTDSGGRILLVRVAPGYPAVGRWTLPGGGLRFGEQPDAGALRELTEETGLVGELGQVLFVSSITQPARPADGLGPWHGIRIVYSAAVVGGTLRDEIDESTDAAAWFTPAEARALPLVELAIAALDHLEAR